MALDIGYAQSSWHGRQVTARLTELCRELGELDAWVRLHYVYPYPHVDELIPLMAEGKILPYLDIPFQHASPKVLKAMRRPAHQVRTLDRIRAWRAICPELALRSTFIVGFPGETEDDFAMLLDWLEEAELDRVGCFKYENVAGAGANDLPGHVPDEVKEERWHRFMAAQQDISARKLQAKVGHGHRRAGRRGRRGRRAWTVLRRCARDRRHRAPGSGRRPGAGRHGPGAGRGSRRVRSVGQPAAGGLI